MSYFTITTTKEVAEQIRKQCEWNEKFREGQSSIELGEITHDAGFSIVQLKAKDGLMKPEDIFWLGHHSSTQNPVTSN